MINAANALSHRAFCGRRNAHPIGPWSNDATRH